MIILKSAARCPFTRETAKRKVVYADFLTNDLSQAI